MSFFGKNNDIELVATKIWFNMYISKSWLVVEQSIRENGIWEEEITKLIKDKLRPWDTFVDVWANIWWFSLLASKVVWDKGKVIAFEPSKYNYNILKRNIDINNIWNIQVIKKWLWSKESQEIIHYVPNNPWHTSIIEDEKNRFFDKEEIEVVTMDAELSHYKNINLIKIDVEWYEYEVFQWMKNIIKRCRPSIILEYTPTFYKNFYNESDDFNIRFLKDILGLWYKIYHINEFSLRWELYKTNNLEELFEKDLGWYIKNRLQSNLLLQYE